VSMEIRANPRPRPCLRCGPETGDASLFRKQGTPLYFVDDAARGCQSTSGAK
jgi:hypothetical protein